MNDIYRVEGGKVIVNEGVTCVKKEQIPGYVLANAEVLVLPKSLKTIQKDAFEYCGMKKVEINGCETIKHGAFFACSNLQSVTLPEGLVSIGKSAFSGTGIRSIELPKSLKRIENQAFLECGALESVCFNDDLEIIEEGAFQECGLLQKVDLHNAVKYIGEKAFFRCGSLQEVNFPNSVETIGERAFEGIKGCGVLYYANGTRCYGWVGSRQKIATAIEIEEGVVCIDDNAFEDCDVTSVLLPSTLKTIGEMAFFRCGSLQEINFPTSVETIGERAFEGVNVCGVRYYANGTRCYGWLGPRQKIADAIEIEEGVVCIDDNAFKDCRVTSVLLPSTLKTIGDSAFNSCDIEQINFPDGLEEIGRYAFKSCAFTQLELPSSVTMIGKGAFSSCGNLETVDLPNKLTSLEDATFEHCSSLKNIQIPNSVKEIGKRAFGECRQLEELTIPKSVTCIGVGAFEKCKSLTSVILPDHLKVIKSETFNKCVALEMVKWPSLLARVDANAFGGCKKLDPSTLPQDVKVDSEAFTKRKLLRLERWLKEYVKLFLFFIAPFLFVGFLVFYVSHIWLPFTPSLLIAIAVVALIFRGFCNMGLGHHN